MTKHFITHKLFFYQVVAHGLPLFLIVGDEIFDVPHRVFNAPATPINWHETFIEGVYVLVLASFSLYLSQRLLKRIKYLEGFLTICAFCKKIHVGEDWIPIENYIHAHSAAEFSHGFCPACVEKHYGLFTKRNQ